MYKMHTLVRRSRIPLVATRRPRTVVKSFERKRPARKPFPDHLPRERVVIAAPTNCPCCGSTKLSKLGEDVTETLEVVPRQWKVIQTVRERFSCRQCEAISQPPAPPAVRRQGSPGGAVLRLARPDAGASRAALGELRRHSAGGRVRRLQPPLSCRPQARPDRRGALLEPRAPQVLRAGRHRRQRPAGQERCADLADRARGRQTHRRALRHRARHQRLVRREAFGCTPGKERSPGRRA